MTTDIKEMRDKLVAILETHKSKLKVTSDTYEKYELAGTVEAMQGKKKVDGIYFATIAPKAKDLRFYFFPSYTHKEQLGELPNNLKKALKGKSCFHIKKMDDEMEENLTELVNNAVKLYEKDGLL